MGKTRKPGLKADYRDATPEQVARALHRYRPKRDGNLRVKVLDRVKPGNQSEVA